MLHDLAETDLEQVILQRASGVRQGASVIEVEDDVFQHNPAGIFANFNPRVPQC
jgi:hypothetical protein